MWRHCVPDTGGTYRRTLRERKKEELGERGERGERRRRRRREPEASWVGGMES
jgi:hypothetical protein